MIDFKGFFYLYTFTSVPNLDAFGQFQDRGNQYRSIIFVENEEQKILAEKSKQQVIASHQFAEPIVTQIKPATTFWPAENYHQQFYKKQQKRYKKIKKSHQQFLFFKRAKKKWSGEDE